MAEIAAGATASASAGIEEPIAESSRRSPRPMSPRLPLNPEITMQESAVALPASSSAAISATPGPHSQEAAELLLGFSTIEPRYETKSASLPPLDPPSPVRPARNTHPTAADVNMDTEIDPDPPKPLPSDHPPRSVYPYTPPDYPHPDIPSATHAIITSEPLPSSPAGAGAGTSPGPESGPSKPKPKRKRGHPSSSRRTSTDPARPPHFMGEDNEVIRCICGIDEDDGLTIQCELCYAWQHALCFGYADAESAPEIYFCELCQPRTYDRGLAMERQVMAKSKRDREVLEKGDDLERIGLGYPGVGAGAGAAGGSGLGHVPPPAGIGEKPKSRGKGKRARLDSSVQDTEGLDRTDKDPSPGMTTATSAAMAPPISKPRRKPGPKPKPKPPASSHTPLESTPAPTFEPSPHSNFNAISSEAEDTYFQIEPWTLEYTPVKNNVVRGREARRIMTRLYREWVDMEEEAIAFAATQQQQRRTVSGPSGLPSPTETGVLRLSPDNLFPSTDYSILAPPVPPVSLHGPDLADLGSAILIKPISSSSSSSFLPLSYLETTPLAGPYTRPSIYGVFSKTSIASSAFIGEFRGEVTDSEAYRRDPINQYSLLGIPKAHVQPIGPPVNLIIDARGYGCDLRFIRSGCHPNVVLRPLLWRSASPSSSASAAIENDSPKLRFGIFASKEIAKNEELVLGWNWDDAHIVHSLRSHIRPTRSADGYPGRPTFHPPLAVGSSTYHALLDKFELVLTHLLGTFSSCACSSLGNCAIAQMRYLVEMRDDEPRSAAGRKGQRADLGVLVGAVRGWRRMEDEKREMMRWGMPEVMEVMSKGWRRGTREVGESEGEEEEVREDSRRISQVVRSPKKVKRTREIVISTPPQDQEDEDMEDSNHIQGRAKSRSSPRSEVEDNDQDRESEDGEMDIEVELDESEGDAEDDDDEEEEEVDEVEEPLEARPNSRTRIVSPSALTGPARSKERETSPPLSSPPSRPTTPPRLASSPISNLSPLPLSSVPRPRPRPGVSKSTFGEYTEHWAKLNDIEDQDDEDENDEDEDEDGDDDVNGHLSDATTATIPRSLSSASEDEDHKVDRRNTSQVEKSGKINNHNRQVNGHGVAGARKRRVLSPVVEDNIPKASLSSTAAPAAGQAVKGVRLRKDGKEDKRYKSRNIDSQPNDASTTTPTTAASSGTGTGAKRGRPRIMSSPVTEDDGIMGSGSGKAQVKQEKEIAMSLFPDESSAKLKEEAGQRDLPNGADMDVDVDVEMGSEEIDRIPTPPLPSPPAPEPTPKPKEPTPPPPEPPKKVSIADYMKNRKFQKKAPVDSTTAMGDPFTESAPGLQPSQSQPIAISPVDDLKPELGPGTGPSPIDPPTTRGFNLQDFLPSSRSIPTPPIVSTPSVYGQQVTESPRPLGLATPGYVPRTEYFPSTSTPAFQPRTSSSYTPRASVSTDSEVPPPPPPVVPAYVPRTLSTPVEDTKPLPYVDHAEGASWYGDYRGTSGKGSYAPPASAPSSSTADTATTPSAHRPRLRSPTLSPVHSTTSLPDANGTASMPPPISQRELPPHQQSASASAGYASTSASLSPEARTTGLPGMSPTDRTSPLPRVPPTGPKSAAAPPTGPRGSWQTPTSVSIASTGSAGSIGTGGAPGAGATTAANGSNPVTSENRANGNGAAAPTTPITPTGPSGPRGPVGPVPVPGLGGRGGYHGRGMFESRGGWRGRGFAPRGSGWGR